MNTPLPVFGSVPGSVPAPVCAPILVADDDDGMRETMYLVLEAEGYRVADAATAADTLAHLRAATASHVVVLDWRMAGGGAEVLRLIAQDGTLRRHCYVLCTAVATSQFTADDQHLIAATCRGVVGKPFDVSQLLETVERAAAQLPSNLPTNALTYR